MKYIYLAGKYEARKRLREIRRLLRAKGHEVCSNWLNERLERDEIEPKGEKERAKRDIDDIDNSTLFILDTIDESTSGGREVEFGYAMLTTDVWHIGPYRNIFHCLADKHFDSWEEALTEL